MLLAAAVIAAALLPFSDGHGNLLHPPAWWDQGGASGLRFGQMCAPLATPVAVGAAGSTRTPYCMWFTNNTVLPPGVEPTIRQPDIALRTYVDVNLHGTVAGFPDKKVDLFARNPWRFPGRAAVDSPCGVGGGNPNGCAGGCDGGGYAGGPDARDIAWPDKVVTAWPRGSQQEVFWGLTANQ